MLARRDSPPSSVVLLALCYGLACSERGSGAHAGSMSARTPTCPQTTTAPARIALPARATPIIRRHSKQSGLPGLCAYVAPAILGSKFSLLCPITPPPGELPHTALSESPVATEVGAEHWARTALSRVLPRMLPRAPFQAPSQEGGRGPRSSRAHSKVYEPTAAGSTRHGALCHSCRLPQGWLQLRTKVFQEPV